MLFQSTPPHGGRPASEAGRLIDILFQSTPPHGGRPPGEFFPVFLLMFQSTPPHGGRPLFSFGMDNRTMFQSTPPHGGRLWLMVPRLLTFSVSIHAPAWGATPASEVAGFKAFSGFFPRIPASPSSLMCSPKFIGA